MRIRRLNDNGLAEFERYIIGLRGGRTVSDPHYMLTDNRTSEAVALLGEVEEVSFPSRYDMGVYLCNVFAGQNMQPYIGDRGLWSWLALFWFNQLCADKSGKRSPAMPYNYVLSGDYRHRPRHAIYITWQLVDRYKEAARFLLCKEMHVRGELIEQLMARQEILSLDGVLRFASVLYTDLDTGHFKKGATSRRSGGSIDRYITWLKQLENNYDLFLATVDDLKLILPKEFQRFLKA